MLFLKHSWSRTTALSDHQLGAVKLSSAGRVIATLKCEGVRQATHGAMVQRTKSCPSSRLGIPAWQGQLTEVRATCRPCGSELQSQGRPHRALHHGSAALSRLLLQNSGKEVPPHSFAYRGQYTGWIFVISSAKCAPDRVRTVLKRPVVPALCVLQLAAC